MLKDISSIVNTIAVSNDFSFVDTLGTFIGNREFYQTYEAFANDDDDPKKFVWTSLSAIGNEFGKKIYENIRDYIDLVSNVDRCKVKVLQSMFNMYGERYNVIDNITKYPIEVQQLVDLFSINKKYLLKNNFLNADFRRELEESESISAFSPLLTSNHDFANDIFIQENYEKYVKSIFKTLLSDFLDLEYNDFDRTKIRKKVEYSDLVGYDEYGWEYDPNDAIQKFRKEYNISPSFDEKKIADDIDEGKDFIEYYQRKELELLELEFQRRARTLTNITKDVKTNRDVVNDQRQSTEQKTRYSYYRKAKFLEYYRFINNFFSDDNNISKIKKYDYDQKFFLVGDGGGLNVLSSSSSGGYDIVEKTVDLAADILKDITQYISVLRERLKIQTRKNYMKGTSNLLTYLINQYLVDYSRSQGALFRHLSGTTISGLRDLLSGHSINNVEVIEYFDETEYFNISASTNSNSINGGSTNPRYWQGWESQNTGQFTNNELKKFYMRDLGLSSDSMVSDLIEFLDFVYNLGANTSYIDKETGKFTARLSSQPDIYSIDLYHELTTLQYHWEEFSKYIISDFPYEYPDDNVSNQISNVVSDYISGYLSVQYLSAVSSVYDKYIGPLMEVSSDLNKLSDKYESFLTDEYEFYYKQSERQYCWYQDGSGYKYDWYISPPDSGHERDNILDKLLELQLYSVEDADENIVFHGLIDTVYALSNSLLELSARFKTDTPDDKTILNRVSGYGYIDLSSETLNESIDDCESFVKTQIDERIAYLKNIVAQLLQTARDLKTEYNTVETTFTQAVSKLEDDNATESLTSEYLYAVAIDKESSQIANCDGVFNGRTSDPREAKSKKEGNHKVIFRELETNIRHSQTIVTNLRYYYYTLRPYSMGDDSGYPYIEYHPTPYDASKDLSTRCGVLMERLGYPTMFTVAEGEVYDMIYQRMDEGIYATCTNTIASLNSITKSFNQLIDTMNSVGMNKTLTNTDIKDKLDELIGILTKVDAVKEFANDSVLMDLNSIKRDLITLRADYNPKMNEYSGMVSDRDFSQYLADFDFNSQTYSFLQLSSLIDYTHETDYNNSQKINTQIDEMMQDYTDVKQKYVDLEVSAQEEILNYNPQGTIIEKQLQNMYNELIQDIQDRYDVGIQKIDEIMEVVLYHMQFVYDELGGMFEETIPLSDAVLRREDQLDYTVLPEYTGALQHFNQYNGICADTDIYYNYKNITHPSKQYHPYMWNFIDAEKFAAMHQNIYKMNIITELEEYNIQSWIDQYIGAFGQSINFWKNQGLDYTGYSSRYETSEHYVGARKARKQDIVDYDGIFFPPAIELLRANNGLNNCLNSLKNKKGELYEKYYEPLGITDDELVKERNRLNTFWKEISAITEELPESQVFDIFKYGLDSFDNAYCLIKQYRDSDGSFFPDEKIPFSVKRNTPGKLWVRKSAYPFAYPAFAKQNGIFTIDPQYTELSTHISVELQSGHIPLSGKIYDFEFSTDKSNIALITENNTISGLKRYDASNMFVATPVKIPGREQDYDMRMDDSFQNGLVRVEKALNDKTYAASYRKISSMTENDVKWWTANEVISSEMSVIFSGRQLSTIVDKYRNVSGTPIENITSDNGALTVLRDFDIYQIRMEREISSIISSTPSDEYLRGYSNGTWNFFIGCIPNGGNDFYASYVKKHVSTEPLENEVRSTVKLEKNTTISLLDYKKLNGDGSSGIKVANVSFPRNPTIDDGAMSKCDSNTIAFAFVLDSVLSVDDSMINAYTLSGKVLSAVNSEGYTREDPFHDEMNSHDVFDSDIYMMKFNVHYSELKPIADMTFNVNADISYLPVYPGKKNLADFNAKDPISADYYHPVELLGQSRNIDDIIEMVNPTPNPYFDLSTISSSYMFGRVYEDYFSDYDKTLRIIGNPPIHNNVPSGDDVEYRDGQFYWNISLTSQFISADYTAKDYQTLRVLMFNRGTYGKNPYFVCDLSSAKLEEVLATYNDQPDGFEVQVTDQIDSTGTYDNSKVNNLESNTLFNISEIGMRFDNDTKNLTIRFKVRDTSIADHTFINEDSICLCLVNDRDLAMFKYYHYMDAYGIYISAENIDLSEFENKEGPGYTIEYDQVFRAKMLSGGYWNYHFDKYGRKEYLRNIDFEDYNYLSDIEVLQGYKSAIFKYDEELYFNNKDPNFYYPTINLKYPKRFGSYIAENAMTMNFSDNINITSLFQDNELFIINAVNPREILKGLGNVRVDVSSLAEDYYIVEEDFYNSETNNRYSHNDARFIEHMILSENKYVISTDNVNVQVQNRYMYDAANELALSIKVSQVLDNIQDAIVDEYLSNLYHTKYPSSTHTVKEAINSGELTALKNDTVYNVLMNRPSSSQYSNINVSYVFKDGFYNSTLLANSTGMFPIKTEDGTTRETKLIDVGNSGKDLSKFLRVYVNYKKDRDNGNGIVLYFNYSNYYNTPFVKLQDSKIYSDIIEGTYLKLNPGESGKLDIVIQFRYHNDGSVCGITNKRVLSYEIFNISDDKPKFVMKEIFRIGRDTNPEDNAHGFDIYGDVTRLVLTNEVDRKFIHTIRWSSTTKIKTIEFDVMFDGELFVAENPPESNVQIDSSWGPSVIHVKVTNPNKRFIELKFGCKKPDETMAGILTTPQVFEIDEVQVVANNAADVIRIDNVENGTVQVG